MHSRHANTGRNIKRRPAQPWIGEIIVVKEYDQMDSLREILDLPARVNGPATEDDNSSSVEHVDVDHPVVDIIEQTSSTTAECGVKRKRAEEIVDETPSEPEVRRRRVMSPSSLCETPKNSESSIRAINFGKENIPPFEVLRSLKSADRVDG